MPETFITAERIFDRHATALDLPALGDKSIDDYVAEGAKDSKEGARQLRAAFDAACVGLHDAVHEALYQARQHIDPRFRAGR